MLPFLFGIIFTAVEFAAWLLFREQAPDQLRQATSTLGNMTAAGVLLHAAAALGIATCALLQPRHRFGSRVALAIFCLIIAAVLPLAGVAVAATLLFILGRPSQDQRRPEEDYVFGNPEAIAARRETRQPQPELRPMVEACRLLPQAELARMIQGMRGLQPVPDVLPLLQRYSNDPQAALQFAAQGVMISRMEDLEIHLKNLKAHLVTDPANKDTHIAAAEVLMAMVEWIPAGDATAGIYAAEAVAHLREAERAGARGIHIGELRARAALLTGDPGTALETATYLRSLSADPTAPTLLEIEALCAAGRWQAAAALAGDLRGIPPHATESIAFLTQPAIA